MKTSGIFLALIIASIFTLSGCVSQQEFDEYKAEQEELRNQMTARMDEADVVDITLDCESQMDLYQSTTGSDAPIGTRRDAPIGTRRDACEAEFENVFGDLKTQCRDEMQACIDQGTTPEQCNECYADCYVNGSWPNTPQCDITP